MKELLIDIDGNKQALNEVLTRVKTVSAITELPLHTARIMKTRNGYHIYLRVNAKLSEMETCLYQTIMGSDYKRECFNWNRVKKQFPKNWNILFSTKKTLQGKILGREKYACLITYGANK